METFDRKKHWENIYNTKKLEEVSWYEVNPKTSLEFFNQFKVPKSAKIIDIGGGDSLLVDHLLDLGFTDITVLDISASAVNRAKVRLGVKAFNVKWIISDVLGFKPEVKYDVWHDRAAFHFFTKEIEISTYLEIAHNNLNPTGILILATFSDNGPKKCSGIDIQQYTEHSMSVRLKSFFKKIKCIVVDHKTPFDTIQNFVFCSFKKLSVN